MSSISFGQKDKELVEQITKFQKENGIPCLYPNLYPYCLN